MPAPTRPASNLTPVESISAPALAPALPQEQMGHVSDVEKMRRYFKGRPLEEIYIRKDEGRQFVQINGYSFQIDAGVRVPVPVDVADLLREAGII